MVPLTAMIEIEIQGLRSRGWEGDSGVLAVRTTDARGNYTRDEALMVPFLVLEAGPLAQVAVSSSSHVTGQLSRIHLTFVSPRNPLDSDSAIALSFSPDTLLSDVDSNSAAVLDDSLTVRPRTLAEIGP